MEGKIVGKHGKVVKEERIISRLFFILAASPLYPSYSLATAPLGIVYFLLTPQEHRRKIPATFPMASGLGEQNFCLDRKKSRIVP
jgi:hypothetical protein